MAVHENLTLYAESLNSILLLNIVAILVHQYYHKVGYFHEA